MKGGEGVPARDLGVAEVERDPILDAASSRVLEGIGHGPRSGPGGSHCGKSVSCCPRCHSANGVLRPCLGGSHRPGSVTRVRLKRPADLLEASRWAYESV